MGTYVMIFQFCPSPVTPYLFSHSTIIVFAVNLAESRILQPSGHIRGRKRRQRRYRAKEADGERVRQGTVEAGRNTKGLRFEGRRHEI